MRWRATAWATWDERIEAPLVASPEIESSRNHSDEYTFEQICAETRRILTGEMALSTYYCPSSQHWLAATLAYASPAESSSDSIPRSWDVAFCEAFQYWRQRGFWRSRMQRLLFDEPDELEERMQAADPHCDIQELSRLFDQYGSEDDDDRHQACCLFDAESDDAALGD